MVKVIFHKFKKCFDIKFVLYTTLIFMDKQKLIAFENKIADLFNKAKIRAPIHLYSNNEEQMIKIFKKIKKNDWVFCSWRSHYQCLLKGFQKKL